METQQTLFGDEAKTSRQIIQEVEALTKQTYSQNWTAYNLAKTKEKLIAEKLLLELMDHLDVRNFKLRGRRGAPLKDRLYAMFLYTYHGSSARRLISELDIAKQRNLIDKVPHFNSVLNYFSYQTATPLLAKLIRITALPLKCVERDVAVDSSGFSTSRFEQWFNIRTQKASKKRCWKKAHIIVGVKSNVIIDVEITEGTCNDSPEFVPLVQKASKYFDLKEVSADKAYSSRENLDAVANLGAIPYIPFKKNAILKSKGFPIWRSMLNYFISNQERFNASYHKRSNVETTFHMIKKNFGNHLRTKQDISHVNEILMKCLCHNLSVLVQESYELGLEIDLNFCAERVYAQERD